MASAPPFQVEPPTSQTSADNNNQSATGTSNTQTVLGSSNVQSVTGHHNFQEVTGSRNKQCIQPQTENRSEVNSQKSLNSQIDQECRRDDTHPPQEDQRTRRQDPDHKRSATVKRTPHRATQSREQKQSGFSSSHLTPILDQTQPAETHRMPLEDPKAEHDTSTPTPSPPAPPPSSTSESHPAKSGDRKESLTSPPLDCNRPGDAGEDLPSIGLSDRPLAIDNVDSGRDFSGEGAAAKTRKMLRRVKSWRVLRRILLWIKFRWTKGKDRDVERMRTQDAELQGESAL
ncbi:hypothetical protein PQX77_015543 [Marasmius sp. AFHP31]|nr:hypothetical protein PQX77_015543 [Marasmius sp. AFHP31]